MVTDTAFVEAHLTREFFATAIGHDLATSVTVSDLCVSAGSSVGDNFCSDIYRAAVSYSLTDSNPAGSEATTTTISLIVKAIPYSATRTPILDNLQVFAKELRMYTDTLPRMSALLGGERLSARCLYAVRDPVQIIVFEDLCAAGFVMADRTTGIDEAHCELVLAKLGRFHGASVVLLEQDETALRHYPFGMFRPGAKRNPVSEAMFCDGLRSLIEVMRTWTGYGGTVKKFERLTANFLTKVDHHCNRTVPAYRVLNHGDLWTNNMLFRYDHDGRPTDVCFIDYQMSFASSPGHDLNYFINTSPQNAVREQRRDHIVQVYQRSFLQTLQRLGSAQTERLTADLLRTEINAREFYGLVAAVGILPMVLMTKGGEHELTLSSMTDETRSAQIQHAKFNNPSYVTAIRYIARRCDVEGVLDAVPDVVL